MKSIDLAIKKWGKQIKQGENDALFSVLPTGSLILDDLLGVGGYPFGRIIEIYGPESSAKTTLGLMAIREAQKINLPSVFIDLEASLDLNWARLIGIDTREEKGFYHLTPEHAEQALNILRILLSDFSLIVFDSIAALVPKSELDGEIGDRGVGNVARLMSQTMRMIASEIKKHNSIVLFINQTRDNIGDSFGPSYETTGGKALRFYTTQRIEVYPSTSLGEKTAPIGNKVRVHIKKNKVSPPRRRGELTLYYDEGISLVQEILDWSLTHKKIIQGGGWYTTNPETENEQKFHGSNEIRNYLKQNIEYENNYRQYLGLPLRRDNDNK